MQERNDIELLREYVRGNSETAFETLVARHVNLVYSVALRKTGNAHAAEEITQAVFIILAKKARGLSPRTILAGWLCETARLTAANFLRGEIRRQRREQEAYMQSVLNESESDALSRRNPMEADWPQIAPLLDDAMAKLGEKDRNAVVLRFFENKNLRDVGTALGASEDAAKMRVTRAVEKLRKFFTKRGVTLTAAAIAGAVSANSVQAAPMGLAVTISATAAKGAAVAASITALVKGTLKIMTYAKLKLVIGITAGILLAGGTATVVVSQNTAAPRTEEESIDAKIVRLNKKGTTVEEAIQVLGEPQKYAMGTNAFAKDHLPQSYLLGYPRGIEVSIVREKVIELRSLKPGPGFTFRNLHVGSSLDEVLKEVGQPSKIVAGETLAWISNPTKPDTSIPGVLYKDLNGIKGFGYYRQPEQHLHFFFKDDKVIGLLIDIPQ
jgi:RNA polymerase sigma factor (sigma-70 family)